MRYILIKKILDTKKTCTTSLLYLETGQIPVRFHIQVMKLHFLKYILNQKKESLVHRFFIAQCEHPTKGDWVSSVKTIMKEVDLKLTFEEIKMAKKESFQNIG